MRATYLNLVITALAASAFMPVAYAFGAGDVSTIAKRLGATAQLGHGKINGRSQPITAILGLRSVPQIEAAVRQYSRGQYTVTNEWSPYGRVIVIGRIFSDQCLTCPKPTVANRAKILASTYAITVLNGAGGFLAYGSPIGSVVANPPSVVVYGGSFLDTLARESALVGHSEFTFGTSSTVQLAGTLRGTPGDVLALARRAFESQGYTQAFTAPEQGATLSHWRRGNSLAQLHISQPSNGQVAWDAYEVTAP